MCRDQCRDCHSGSTCWSQTLCTDVALFGSFSPTNDFFEDCDPIRYGRIFRNKSYRFTTPCQYKQINTNKFAIAISLHCTYVLPSHPLFSGRVKVTHPIGTTFESQLVQSNEFAQIWGGSTFQNTPQYRSSPRCHRVYSRCAIIGRARANFDRQRFASWRHRPS